MSTNPFENSKIYGQQRGFIVPLIAVFLALATLATAVIFPILALSSRFRHQGDPLNQVFGGGQGLRGVPAPYDEIFQRAGDQFQVQPAFLAAIFVSEHGPAKIYRPGYEPITSPGAQWPEAGGDPEAIILWDDSGAGALGPFQFMPGTWPGHAQDGNGDGRKDHENIVDAAFAAAHYLAGIGAGGYTTDLDKLRDAASIYNSGRPWDVAKNFQETARYVPRVMVAFQQFYAEAAMAQGGANRIVAIAQGELGVSCPNDICPKYGGANGQKWCAFFVSWVYNQAGFPMNPVKIGSVDAMYNYFQQNHQIILPSGSPAPGDVAFFSEYGHVVIVESVQGNIITYIAGNNRNDMVARETLPKSSFRGYGRW